VKVDMDLAPKVGRSVALALYTRPVVNQWLTTASRSSASMRLSGWFETSMG